MEKRRYVTALKLFVLIDELRAKGFKIRLTQKEDVYAGWATYYIVTDDEKTLVGPMKAAEIEMWLQAVKLGQQLGKKK